MPGIMLHPHQFGLPTTVDWFYTMILDVAEWVLNKYALVNEEETTDDVPEIEDGKGIIL